jgi:hypothetical protein
VKNKSESILDNLVIAAPCSIPWESMQGNERERSCAGCSKTVYNISDMTKLEAERFLAERGTSECMRFFRRTDGTIMTDNCPRALRKIRDQYRFAARAVASVFAALISVPAAFCQERTSQNATPGVAPHVNPLSDQNAHQPRALYGKPVRWNTGTRPVPQTHIPQAMAGGAMPFPGRVVQITPTTPVTTPVVTTIEATLLTKDEVLPDGRKVILVNPSERGKVIVIQQVQVQPPQTQQLPVSQFQDNEMVETDALKHFTHAQELRRQGNLALSEFFFEKALSSFDEQKNKGDAKFRNAIETELNNVRSQQENQSNQP